LKASEVPYAT